jgi:hypothetical protein
LVSTLDARVWTKPSFVEATDEFKVLFVHWEYEVYERILNKTKSVIFFIRLIIMPFDFRNAKKN